MINENPSISTYLFNIILDLPLEQYFTYSSEVNLAIGQRVLVDFKNKKMVGFVWQRTVKEDISYSLSKIKPILYVFSEIIPQDVLGLIKFAAHYYHYPTGATFFTAIPSLLRKPEVIVINSIKYVSLINPEHSLFTKKLGKNQLALYKQLQNGTLTISAVKELLGASYLKLLDNWECLGIIKIFSDCHKLSNPIITNKLPLNQEQSNIVSQLSETFAIAKPALLYGITGSGKTEVYLELIEQVILDGKQVLVLVPEINLTPQLLDRFKKRFSNVQMHILTSNINDKARVSGYLEAGYGTRQIIIGTRMAVFTPFKNLGLIIVDEEHDSSFKQNESLRYNARNLAVFRANYHNIPILLGSATPSLETLYNYKLKKYSLYKLTSRAVSNATLPSIKLIDLNTTPASNGLTNIVIDSIRNRLENKELSLIYINRRGYAPVVSCYECGWVSHCTSCTGNMVYHNKDARLKCHHCGFTCKLPNACPKCESKHLQAIGYGTQKIEESLEQCFPEARILRIDRDTTSSKLAWDILYKKVHNNEVDILVGTQMLTKGHDFHNLTLVVGLNLDSGLYSHDFRSTEFLFTQLMQVSGRAGRGVKPGEVLLQTHYPHHELYQYLIKHDFSGFANFLLKERKILGLPPYTYYALFRASGKTLDNVMEFLNRGFEIMQQHKSSDINVFNPVPSVMQRLKNKERGQLLLSSSSRNNLHDYIATVLPLLGNLKQPYRYVNYYVII